MHLFSFYHYLRDFCGWNEMEIIYVCEMDVTPCSDDRLYQWAAMIDFIELIGLLRELTAFADAPADLSDIYIFSNI